MTFKNLVLKLSHNLLKLSLIYFTQVLDAI